MSKILAEQLLAGIMLGDNDNQEYIFLPGGEVGSDTPCCVFESKSRRQDLPLDKAVEQAKRRAVGQIEHHLHQLQQ